MWPLFGRARAAALADLDLNPATAAAALTQAAELRVELDAQEATLTGKARRLA
ncbi:hypothetical protein [Kitasatospora sp. NPDC002040]|uniref:hypothetical protein n=1 Tax=Kitasatospora sp. NPDC002040 TaxID=3154661 RepID=UPI003319E5D1